MKSRICSVLIYLTLAILLAGCFGCQLRPVSYTDKASETVTTRVDLGKEEYRPPRLAWLTFFDDVRLKRLIARALDENPDLIIAWNRLQQARVAADAARSRLWPDITAGPGWQRMRQRALPLGFGAGSSALPFASMDKDATQDLTVYNASLAASYELDIWGRLRSRARAAANFAEATRYDYDALAMTLAAVITRKWVQLQALTLRIRLLNKQLETLQQQILLMEIRLGRGLASGIAVSRQEEFINERRHQLALARQEFELTRHQLACLAGQPPQTFSLTVSPELPDLPKRPPLGTSPALLKRRPDVQASFARLQAGDEQIAAAVADRFPQLTLSADLFSNATQVSHLGSVLLSTLQAAVTAVVFDGGYTSAQVESAMARTRQALYQYKDAVLNAFKDVADALENETRQQERIRYVHQQTRAARQGLSLARLSYMNGDVPYLTVLEARVRLHDLEIRKIRERMQQLVFRIQLHRALGGQWPERLKNHLEKTHE